MAATLGLSLLTHAASGREHLGFVVTKFSPAIYLGSNDCPTGLAPSLKESFLATQPPAERERLQRPENSEELERKYKIDYTSGPGGEDICRNPSAFDHPQQPTVQGKVAYGFDLDGSDGTGPLPQGTCAHENFTSAEGERGIDNQLYRANGCLKFYRGIDQNLGDLVKAYNSYLREGIQTILLELIGVDDVRDDPEVEVGIYSTDSAPLLDRSGEQFLPDGSYLKSAQASWRNTARGRIVAGVLTTEPVNLRLKRSFAMGGLGGAREEYDLRSARFRLHLRQDRTLQGLMGAYQSLDGVDALFRSGGKGTASEGGIDCASERKTLELMADGSPDPTTGQCTAISLAYDVEAIPAFLFDAAPVGKNATTGADREEAVTAR